MEFTGERFIPEMSDIELEIEHIQRYELLKEVVRDKIILDAACGEGYGSYLLSQTAMKVTGLDIDAKSIAYASEKYNNANVDFLVSTINKLPFEDNAFDAVVSFETLEHVDFETQVLFMREIKRVLKENGILIISTPNKKYYSDEVNYTNPFHVKELYREEFIEMLENHYNHVNVVSQRFEVASIIDNKELTSIQYNMTVIDQESEIKEKYMIAFCSDSEELANPTFSVTTFPHRYNKLSDRISQLQVEVEERNIHISTLDKEIGFLREQFNSHEILRIENQELRDQKDEIQRQLLKKEGDVANLEQELSLCIQNRDQKHSELLTKLNNRAAHIALLLEQERKLNNIYQSSGWRLLTKYYKLRDFLIPANSKRRVISKLAVKTLKHPKDMFSKLNKSNVKKLKYYLSSEDATLLESRIDSYIERNTEQSASNHDIELFLDKEYGRLQFNSDENPLVTIIIPVYNQWDYTYSCLASILQNTEGISYEIIIADDMSSDETVNINNYVENITVIRDGENRGFLLNCNNAAGYAKGKYLFFLNNDTNVQPDWLTTLVRLIESDPTIGMVGSKLIYPDGKQQEAGGIIWNDASGWNFGRLDDPEKAEYNYVKEVDYISGAAILLRHDLWSQIGGFDERYVPAYFEDSDLAFEIRKLGYKVMLQPQSVIVHFEGISHGTDTNSGIKNYQIQNKEKFLDKWRLVLKDEHFANAEHVFWARDRSRNKKTIVIVDHYVPHYDKDAGGRCTYFYIKLMTSMGFHVIFIGDNFFRHEPYTTELQQMGVEVLYGNGYAKNINQWIKSNGQYIDYVYMNRPHISIKYMDVFKKFTKAKIIYFGHDLHYLREMRNYELTKNPTVLKSAEEWKQTEFSLFKKADVIHVVGSYEHEVLSKEFPNKPIRNIPLFPYEHLYASGHQINSFEQRRDLLFVGGFNHKPNYDGIVWFINSIFPTIKESLPDIKLYIVGSNPPDDLNKLQSESIVITGYVSDEELEGYYNQCRLVVVPLRFGAGVKGKVVEAIYYQVPVVTTSIGAEGLENTKNVLNIADQEAEFANSVIHLCSDSTQWSLNSRSSGEYIERYFTLEAARNILSLDIEN